MLNYLQNELPFIPANNIFEPKNPANVSKIVSFKIRHGLDLDIILPAR